MHALEEDKEKREGLFLFLSMIWLAAMGPTLHCSAPVKYSFQVAIIKRPPGSHYMRSVALRGVPSVWGQPSEELLTSLGERLFHLCLGSVYSSINVGELSNNLVCMAEVA